MRLVDADALPSDVMLPVGDDDEEFEFVYMRAIEAAPTVNAEPIKHGEWIGCTDGTCLCSRCLETNSPTNYCPNCGARMDGGERKENDVYCDRNLCAQNEYNGIECDECQKMRKDEAEA